MIIRSDSTILQ